MGEVLALHPVLPQVGSLLPGAPCVPPPCQISRFGEKSGRGEGKGHRWDGGGGEWCLGD